MLENRIYIVSIGLRSGWILKSIKKLRPDFIYLLENKNEKNKEYFKAKNEIVKEIKKKEILKEEIKYSGDEYYILKFLKEIISKHSKDKIYLNLDAGDRRIPSTFILSSFLFSSINSKIYLVSFKSESEEVIEFPSFKVKLPEKKLIEVLKEIQNLGDICTKKKLSEVLISKKILKVNKDTSQNILMSLNRNFLQKLIDWGFIDIDGKRKNALIQITPEGEKWLKFM